MGAQRPAGHGGADPLDGWGPYTYRTAAPAARQAAPRRILGQAALPRLQGSSRGAVRAAEEQHGGFLRWTMTGPAGTAEIVSRPAGPPEGTGPPPQQMLAVLHTPNDAPVEQVEPGGRLSWRRRRGCPCGELGCRTRVLDQAETARLLEEQKAGGRGAGLLGALDRLYRALPGPAAGQEPVL